MKKQQQLEEWQRVKDEKLKAELEAEDHDRRALQEAGKLCAASSLSIYQSILMILMVIPYQSC